MPKPTITKTNTVETFIKEATGMRVKKDAVDYFFDQLCILSEKVVKTAQDTANKEDRSTIMLRDMQLGMADFTGSSSDLAFLFKQLEKLSAKDTADLSQLIQKWVESH